MAELMGCHAALHCHWYRDTRWHGSGQIIGHHWSLCSSCSSTRVTYAPFNVCAGPSFTSRHDAIQGFTFKGFTEIETKDVVADRSIGKRDRKVAFEPTCPEKRRIDNAWVIRCTNDDDAFMHLRAVQQL
ncbi:hypothetical protein D3C72_1833250 [compost metagenome]